MLTSQNESSQSKIIIVPFKEYLDLQINEILSSDNLWFAGERIGHEPNTNEAAIHYIESGAAERLAERYVPAETMQTSSRELAG